jgi:hypothetical protein
MCRIHPASPVVGFSNEVTNFWRISYMRSILQPFNAYVEYAGVYIFMCNTFALALAFITRTLQ